MKIFLSWAGTQSQYIAECLRDWLPQVIQSLDPWMSTHIDKGEAWDGAIAEGLNDSPVGILCLTKDSIKSNYLHYEAGAIANVPGAKVCTFLYDVTNVDVVQPLARFQHTSYKRDEIFKLMQTINAKVIESKERGLTELQLEKSFEINWPELVNKVQAVPSTKTTTVQRKDRELLEEILQLLRDNNTSNQVHSSSGISAKSVTLPKRYMDLSDERKLLYFSRIEKFMKQNDFAPTDLIPHKQDLKAYLAKFNMRPNSLLFDEIIGHMLQISARE